jgi:mannose-6-phosphate isomerase-like protein (cupin superfamily)
MTLIKQTEAPAFEAGGTTVTAYAAPSRGATQLALWQIELRPGSTSPRHHMDCEEVFLGLAGEAIVEMDGVEHSLGAGDCLILAAGTDFTIHVPGGEPFRAVACVPTGAQAIMTGDEETFSPPWTL